MSKKRGFTPKNLQEYMAHMCVVALNNGAQYELKRYKSMLSEKERQLASVQLEFQGFRERLRYLDGDKVRFCRSCNDLYSNDKGSSCDTCHDWTCEDCQRACDYCHGDFCENCIYPCEQSKCVSQFCSSCGNACEKCGTHNLCKGHAAECCESESQSSSSEK